ncbi:hypothetical protein D3C80_1550820 [compost metagenome]
MGRQHFGNRPGLPTVLSHKPAGLSRYPWQRQTPQGPLQQPGFALFVFARRGPERADKQAQHQHARENHQAKTPEQAEHIRDGVLRCLPNLFSIGIHHTGGVFLQQQAVTQVLLDRIKRSQGGC